MRTKKLLITLILIFNTALVSSAKAAEDEWLLWGKSPQSLPAQISTMDYPPLILFRQGNEIHGSLSTPYSFESNDLPTTADFRIVIIDAENTTHLLTQTNRSIGFVAGKGVSIVTLKAADVSLGKITVHRYKKNTLANRKKLREANRELAIRTQKIKKQQSALNLNKMALSKAWSFASVGEDGINYDVSQIKSNWTIIDLYSQTCAPCLRSIQLHARDDVYVLGLSGTKALSTLSAHIVDKKIQYPIIPFIGEYMEAALPKALNTVGYPTYYLLDANKRFVGQFSGVNALNKVKERIKS